MGEHNCYHKDVDECIQKKAYELWDKDGRKKDSDVDYWLKAEKTVKAVKQVKKPTLLK
jgi:hypothetical protein